MTATEIVERKTVAGNLRLARHEASMNQLITLMDRMKVSLEPADFIQAVAVAFQEQQRENADQSMEGRFRTEPSFQLFQKALRIARERRNVESICVLGCGPGFAGEPADFPSTVVREVFGSGKRPDITLLNLSSSTLRQDPEAIFAKTTLDGRQGGADLVVAHSFLHYVPDVSPVFTLIRRLLRPRAGLILSHEPNARFWQNVTCQSAVAGLRSQQRIPRLQRYLRVVRASIRRAGVNRPPTFWDQVNLRLKEHYGFADALAENEIRRLVDVHRPEAVPGNFRIGLDGFDFEEFSRIHLQDFSLEYVATAGHLGYGSSSGLTSAWRQKELTLAIEEPLAGCVFTAYWSRHAN